VGKPSQLVLTTEGVRDDPWVDDVVPVLRTLARLQRRRQVKVRHTELLEIRHELPRRRKAELRSQLQPVRRAKLHLLRRRQSRHLRFLFASVKPTAKSAGVTRHAAAPPASGSRSSPRLRKQAVRRRSCPSRARAPNACRSGGRAGETRSPRSAR